MCRPAWFMLQWRLNQDFVLARRTVHQLSCIPNTSCIPCTSCRRIPWCSEHTGLPRSDRNHRAADVLGAELIRGSTSFLCWCLRFSVGRGLEQPLSSAVFGCAFPLVQPSSPVAVACAHLQNKALAFESVSCLGKPKWDSP